MKNTCLLHCNGAPKNFFNHFFIAGNGLAIAIFTSISFIFWVFIFHINVSVFLFTTDAMIEDSLIEIFPSINSKREKRKFYFLKGIHNFCKFPYKIMVRFSNSIFRVIRFAAIWISKFQNIHFPNVIKESFFFGFHVKKSTISYISNLISRAKSFLEMQYAVVICMKLNMMKNTLNKMCLR